ncbi:MAG: hypothetical protein RSC41_03040 [Oscillospiraceae bacterium]
MAKLLEKSKTILKDKNGNFAVVLGGGFLLLLCCGIFIMCFETNRTMFITNKIQNTISDGIVSAARNNLYESFPTIRQSNSGAYEYKGSGYRQIKDISGFEDNLCSLYELTKTSNSISRKIGQSTLWKICNINIYVLNAAHDETSEYLISYDIAIPHKFLWKEKTLILQDQQQTVHYKTTY